MPAPIAKARRLGSGNSLILLAEAKAGLYDTRKEYALLHQSLRLTSEVFVTNTEHATAIVTGFDVLIHIRSEDPSETAEFWMAKFVGRINRTRVRVGSDSAGPLGSEDSLALFPVFLIKKNEGGYLYCRTRVCVGNRERCSFVGS